LTFKAISSSLFGLKYKASEPQISGIAQHYAKATVITCDIAPEGLKPKVSNFPGKTYTLALQDICLVIQIGLYNLINVLDFLI